MNATTQPKETPRIPVAEQDLIEVWSLLEKLVVSIRKMGSHYATPDAHTPLSPNERQKELEDLDRFISPELFREMAHARRVLVEYLPDERTEFLSENVIQFWNPQNLASGTGKE